MAKPPPTPRRSPRRGDPREREPTSDVTKPVEETKRAANGNRTIDTRRERSYDATRAVHGTFAFFDGKDGARGGHDVRLRFPPASSFVVFLLLLLLRARHSRARPGDRSLSRARRSGPRNVTRTTPPSPSLPSRSGSRESNTPLGISVVPDQPKNLPRVRPNPPRPRRSPPARRRSDKRAVAGGMEVGRLSDEMSPSGRGRTPFGLWLGWR